MSIFPNVKLTRRLLLRLLLTLSVLLSALPARAHELEIDTLSIRLESRSREIAGQFLLDPDLTRRQKGEGAFVDEKGMDEKGQVIAFVTSHVAILNGEKPIPLMLEVRELYEKGGAVPGDSVIFSALLPDDSAPLSVSIKPPLERIFVTKSMDTATRPTVLVTGSEPVVVSAGVRSRASESDGAGAGSTISPESATRSQVRDYIWTGVTHIIPLGWDHILFVIALTLGSRSIDSRERNGRLLLELTAFTLAHTLTLALGALRVVNIPDQIVEPLIAFSISAVAFEYMLGWKDRRARSALVGIFGLVHGFGFAGALEEVGLSGPPFLAFLASFNLGVEIGQIAVVLLALSLFWLLDRCFKSSETILRAGTLAIALTGLTVGIARIV